jgi:hypothetical protein
VSRATRIGLVLLVAASAPLALAFEAGVRQLLGLPELDEVRHLLRPTATGAAWALAGLCVVAAALGLGAQRRWCEGRMRVAAAAGEDPARAVMDRTFLAMSIPQVPAVLSTVAFMTGSELAPVLAAMAISTVGVLAQGLQWEALLARARR